MEPTLTGHGDDVIYSPTTAVIDIDAALKTLTDTLPQNVEIVYGTKLMTTETRDGVTYNQVQTADEGPVTF